MRVGVFLPNWVGDVVMATPALRALRTYAGRGPLVGVMRPYVGEVLAGGEWFDETIAYAKGERDVASRLRSARLDAVVLLTNSLRTGWMAFRSGAPTRVGMAGNLRSPLLTTAVYPPRRRWRRAPLPTVAGYLQVVQALGAPPVAPTLELATTVEDERAADDAWRRLGWSGDQPTAVFNTGGAFGAAKDWPGEHFAALARRLVTGGDWRVLINCGPKERDAARRRPSVERPFPFSQESI